MKPNTYSERFYDFLARSSGKSAGSTIQALEMPVSSVLDVGCGQGAWLAAWMQRGVTDVLGLDGDYVARTALQIPPAAFRPTDISRTFALARKFDLVQCLEVAEHIPAEHAGTLIDNLARHGDVILFSAATPGQGGVHHVNEQPMAYWAAHFADRGYAAFDCLRPRIRSLKSVEPWYRYNIMIFANADGEQRLPDAMLRTKVPDGTPFADFSDVLWRIRCGLTRWLPRAWIDRIAQLKHAWILRRLS